MKVEATSFAGGSVGIAINETDSEVVDFQAADKGGIILPATFEGTEISFKVCGTSNGTFVPLYDSSNAIVKLTVTQDRAYALPAALAPFKFFKLVSNAAGGENAAVEIEVQTKY